jgi:hypothetical protein
MQLDWRQSRQHCARRFSAIALAISSGLRCLTQPMGGTSFGVESFQAVTGAVSSNLVIASMRSHAPPM